MIFGVPEDLFNTAKDYMVQPYRGQKSIGAWVIEATEFKFEVRNDLRGHMEVALASEATIVAIPGNMHIKRWAKKRGCLLSYSQAEPGRE